MVLLLQMILFCLMPKDNTIGYKIQLRKHQITDKIYTRIRPTILYLLEVVTGKELLKRRRIQTQQVS
jgi:hypothetical protein